MDEDVNGLALAPFRDVVEKGKAALESAKEADSEPMQKAAEKLIKEGERALKKIEPLCKKLLDEYGPNFTDALKENDDIASFRSDLNDALWEFDDFIEPDDFDAEKFTELQALSRKAAPKIYDILMRMKLEHPHPEPEPSIISIASGKSRSASAAGNAQMPDAAYALSAPTQDEPLMDMPPYPVHPDEEPAPVMGIQGGPDAGLEVPPLQLQKQKTPEPVVPEPRSADSIRSDEAPPRPPYNPWEPTIHTVIPSDVRDTAQTSEVEPPEPPVDAWVEEIMPPASPSIGRVPTFPRPGRLDDGVERMMKSAAGSPGRRESIQASGSSNGAGFFVHDLWSPNGGVVIVPEVTGSSVSNRPASATLMEAAERAPENGANGQNRSPVVAPFPESPIIRSHRNSHASSESQPSMFDSRARDSLVSPVTDYNRTSIHSMPREQSPSRESFHSATEQPSTPAGVMASFSNPIQYPQTYSSQFHPNLPPVPQEQPVRSTSQRPMQQPGLEATGLAIDDGLIPVENDLPQQDPAQHPPTRQQDCTITISSSYYQFKGFCEGAKDVIRGGLGVKKAKKPVGIAGQVTVAKCKNCLYELEWKSVETDLNNSEAGNYQTAGVGYRLRFLSKSHVASRYIDDHFYACLFCVQLGRTTEESDATVFFTQKQLFSHIARHPRPLPQVAGVAVIEDSTIPSHMRNNYDLHLPNPPEKSLMSGISREICAMPSAIATESFRITFGTLKTPPGNPREPVLQFPVGAKIVGIEYPVRYKGEWAIGWADNTRAAFPVEYIKLEPPLRSDIRMQPASNLRAVARWTRKIKDKDKDKDKDGVEWLKFEKGDIITGIGFPYIEHWCWSGYNPKGKYGIFPQAFIEPNSLREAPAADRASLLSQESKTGMFSRMSIRKNRPGSSGGPSSSDILSSRPPRPPIH